jgi:CelD/BcsL family acetyltransferase involved in cellulose biosynthesis
MALTTEKITQSQFQSLASEWNTLLAASRANNPFMRWEWFESWRLTLGPQREWYFLCVRDGDKRIAFAPFVIKSGGARTLELCGSELYPDYMDIIVKPDYATKAVGSIIEYLLSNSDDWGFASFDNLLSDSVLLTQLSISRNNLSCDIQKSSSCPILQLDGTMDEYLGSQFKKKKRYNLKRQVRQLLDDQDCSIERTTDPSRLDAAVADMLLLHDKRTAAKNIASSIENTTIREFFAQVSRRFMAADILELWFVRKDGKAISALYGFRMSDRLYYYQSGVDPDWERWSAGTVLLMKVIEYAFSEKLAVFDFLKGDEEYKKTWLTGVQTEYRLRMYRSDIKSQLIRMIHRLRSLVSNLIRRKTA